MAKKKYNLAYGMPDGSIHATEISANEIVVDEVNGLIFFIGHRTVNGHLQKYDIAAFRTWIYFNLA